MSPPLDKLNQQTGIKKLENIMSILRGENGCQWDKKQTHESLRPYLIEECFEVLEAIDEKDDEAFASELGDLLLQIIFHCQIAKEAGRFDLDAVADKCSEMLLRRHPHVFDKNCQLSAEEVELQWEAIKTKEKRHSARSSILDGIPKSLPHALRLEKMLLKGAKKGFEWPNITPVIDKLKEEIEEFENELKNNQHEAALDELGDVLCTCFSLARHMKVSVEDLSQRAALKFSDRFRKMEAKAKESQINTNDLDLDSWQSLWEKVKQQT